MYIKHTYTKTILFNYSVSFNFKVNVIYRLSNSIQTVQEIFY